MTSKNNSESLIRIVLFREKHIFKKCMCKLNVNIFYFPFALDIILVDRCDRKTPKQLFYSNKSNRKAMNRNWSNQKSNPALKTKAGNG